MAGIIHDGSHGEQMSEYEFLDPSAQELIRAAVEARKQAYCPYSNFAVGAAVRTSKGDIFSGCNIEVASFSPTICAERVAMSKAISAGQKEFTGLAVVANTAVGADKETEFTSPCGVCRQFMSEFAPRDFPVYLAKPAVYRVLVTSVVKLLPLRFISYKNN